MTTVLFGCALILAINLALSLVCLSWGPSPVNRLMATQLVATLAVAQLLVLAQVSNDPSLRLVALTLALLGAVSVATLLRVTSESSQEDTP